MARRRQLFRERRAARAVDKAVDNRLLRWISRRFVKEFSYGLAVAVTRLTQFRLPAVSMARSISVPMALTELCARCLARTDDAQHILRFMGHLYHPGCLIQHRLELRLLTAAPAVSTPARRP